ncbi:MAG: AI-2E family transporter [Firmicutes bacterium]|nr:AI-2E family transporter [Bacillota bacterium]
MDTKDMKETNEKGRFKQNIILLVLGVTLLVALMNFKTVAGVIGTVFGLFMPLIVGGIIAFILNVPMHFFEKQFDRINSKKPMKWLAKLGPALSLVITLVLFAAVISFIAGVIFPNLAESFMSIAAMVRDAYPGWLAAAENFGIDTSVIGDWLAKLDFSTIMESLKNNSGKILFTAGQAASGVFSIVSNFGFGLVFAIYILMSKKKLGVQAKKIAYAYLKKEWADEICDVASLSYRVFSNFLSGQCLEAVILGLMFFVALTIGGFPYAATIALIIGAMSLIPFVGAFIGMVFGMLLISVEGLKQVIIFVIVFLVVQQIEGQIVYPRVVGGSVGLPAIWTLLAVVVGGKVSGIFGIILFIPLFSVLYALLRRSVHSRLRKKSVTVE